MQDYKKIFDSLWELPFLAAALTDSDGLIIKANVGFLRLIDKNRDNIKGRLITELFLEVFDPIFAKESGLRLCEKRFSQHENVRTWNGKKFSLEIAVVTFSDEGEVFIEIRDNSHFQESYNRILSENKKLNIALENINDGVITTNKNDRIILVNNGIEKIFGVDKTEMIGKSIIDIFILFEADYSVYAGKMKFSTIFGMARQDSMVINDTVVVTMKSGEKRTLLVSSTRMMDNMEQFSGFLYVIRDITEQIKIETMMNISRKMESIGQLAAGIAHEINTPMQYISDNITFLQDAFNSLYEYCGIYKKVLSTIDPGTPGLCELQEEYERRDVAYLMQEIPAAIDQSRMGVEKVSRIVLAMKNFAHPGAKDKAFSDINEAIRVTTAISRNEYKYVADLELDLDENLPPVFCLIDEINQVILNMIINSAHAIKDKTDAGIYEKGLIRIITRYMDSHAEIIIRDTGMGIDSEIIDKIYDPFFTTKEVGKGTGQGLSIAHNIIVQQHKGDIHVESEKGEYSKFTITLPVGPDENGGSAEDE